jgi:hypothetical protein
MKSSSPMNTIRRHTRTQHLIALTAQGLDTWHCDPLYQLRRDLYDKGWCVSQPCILVPSTSTFLYEPESAQASWLDFPLVGSKFGRRIVNAACEGVQRV